jgi:signal transduction histidine kinase
MASGVRSWIALRIQVMPAQTLLRPPKECPLASALAERLRASRDVLVRHWLDRISARVSLAPNQVFPTEDLLDHVPLLIDGVADYIENPAAEVSADTPVVGKAMELGELRHAQGFDAYQIMKEYEILGGIIFHYLSIAADEMPQPCEKSELLACGQRLFRAIAIIQQTTTTQYLRLADERVAERENRLRAFNRMVSHEIKNHVGAILGAGDLLATIPELEAARQMELKELVVRNARALKSTLDNLVELSRLDNDARQHRHIRLPQAAAESCRELREAARAARVELRVSSELPDVEVNAAVVELALTNYLSNAIKYANPAADQRFVEIDGEMRDGPVGRELVVCVRDNGPGVAVEKRAKLFERFYRAHDTVTDVEGTGLGLSIVREMIESVGGRAWAEFPERGAAFYFAVPARRDEGEGARRG